MIPCFFCELSFPSLNTLMLHVRLRHKTSLYSTVECKVTNCFKKYANVYSLKHHLIRDHKIKESQNCYNTCNNAPSYDKNTLCTNMNPELSDIIINNTIEEKYKVPDISDNVIIPLNILETLNINNYEDMNLNIFRDVAIKAALYFISHLYAYGSLSRKAAHNIINEINNSYLSIIFFIISKKFNGNDDLCTMLHVVQNVFQYFKSEHLTFAYLKNIECLFVPTKIIIRSYLTSGRLNKRVRTIQRNATLSSISLKQVICKFLELPDVYSSILLYMRDCKDNHLLTFFNSEYWKTVINKNTDKIVLPLVLYFDDVEINNPLGSRKCIHKIGVVYCSILGLPNQFSSMIQNIFLVQIHNYQDHKLLGNKKIFQHVINHIIDLQENGIIISINGEQHKIYFVLAFIVGDNLGLNTILGYPRSFNANYCCRICYEDISTLKNTSFENDNKIRTVENYAIHLRDLSFGLQEECVFHAISNFHVISNASVDPMHDILEGICRYDVAKILHNFIYEESFFTLDVLNDRILYFNNVSSSKNIPPNLSRESIKNKVIIISASEMKFLVENLNFIIGDLIPENNCMWKLYLFLSEILYIVSLSAITLENIERFNFLVHEYMNLNLKLFKICLKVKHHHLLHYPRIMKKFGPLHNMSSIRYEAKHKQLKENSKVITSRKNASYTLALKHQLQLCYRFVRNEGFSKRITYGNYISKIKMLNIHEYLKKLLPALSDDIGNYDVIKWVQINGTDYRKNDILNVSKSNLVSLGKIEYVITNRSNILFMYQSLKCLNYNEHFRAYEIEEEKQYDVISKENLIDYKVYNLHILSNKKRFVPFYLNKLS